MTKPTPIIDTREKKFFTFSESYFEKPIIKKLDAGDYSLLGMENLVTVERKSTVLEIAGNMTQSRFKDAIERVSSLKHKILICEFDYSDIVSFPFSPGISNRVRAKLKKISANWIISYMLDLTVKYNIPVFYAGNATAASFLTQSYLRKIWIQNS